MGFGRDLLLVYACLGSSYYAYKAVISAIRWWNDPSREFDTFFYLKVDEKLKLSIRPLETFYEEWPSEMRQSVVQVIKQFCITRSGAPVIGLIRKRLCSQSVQERRSAITALSGLLMNVDPSSLIGENRRPPNYYKHRFADYATIECIMLGLFESLEPDCINTAEECLYRDEVMNLILEMDIPPAWRLGGVHSDEYEVSMPRDEAYVMTFIEHGIVDFFLEYQKLCDFNQKYVHPLARLTDSITAEYSHSWTGAFEKVIIVIHKYNLNLIPWETVSKHIHWRRARLIAEANMPIDH